jgi:hypothetical protein
MTVAELVPGLQPVTLEDLIRASKGMTVEVNRVDFRRDSKVWKGGPQSASLGGRS